MSHLNYSLQADLPCNSFLKHGDVWKDQEVMQWGLIADMILL